MAQPVKYRIREGVAIVTLASPPSNAISGGTRAALWEVFARIEDNQEAQAAILIAEGGLFSGGADIRELATREAAPTLGEVCRRIETARLPVVAGLHGAAFGAGADLALACHHRLAASEAVLALPEVTLGMVPSGGATQRLPRLVGAKLALDLLLSGRRLTAEAARQAGILDGIVSGHLHTGTWNFAKSLIARDAKPDPVSDRETILAEGSAFLQAIAERRVAIDGGRLFAAKRIVDCVEAALLLPFDAGCALEADAADRCRTHPQSTALRHAFIAESRIAPRLMTLEAGKRVPTEPDGTAVVVRLRAAMKAAIAHLLNRDISPELIDKSLIDFGFLRTPHGGVDGGAGADGTAIAHRIVAALMAEGARILGEGLVERAGDIDALAIHGMGFPRLQGGPMKAAEIIGLLALRKRMEAWSREDPIWMPPALLAEALKTSAGFDAIRPARDG